MRLGESDKIGLLGQRQNQHFWESLFVIDTLPLNVKRLTVLKIFETMGIICIKIPKTNS